MKNNLIKYDNIDSIKKRFPYFQKNDRLFYNVIYAIKTENPHFYVDIINKTICNTILICCNTNTKIYNVMFELDSKIYIIVI